LDGSVSHALHMSSAAPPFGSPAQSRHELLSPRHTPHASSSGSAAAGGSLQRPVQSGMQSSLGSSLHRPHRSSVALPLGVPRQSAHSFPEPPHTPHESISGSGCPRSSPGGAGYPGPEYAPRQFATQLRSPTTPGVVRCRATDTAAQEPLRGDTHSLLELLSQVPHASLRFGPRWANWRTSSAGHMSRPEELWAAASATKRSGRSAAAQNAPVAGSISPAQSVHSELSPPLTPHSSTCKTGAGGAGGTPPLPAAPVWRTWPDGTSRAINTTTTPTASEAAKQTVAQP
jgi:hypothetical protein